MLALQRSVGNRATAALLQREEDLDKKGWENKPFGALIYDKLIKEYTPEKLLKLATPQLTTLAGKMPEVAADGVMSGKDVKAGVGGVAAFAQKAAEEWMKTDDGKAWLAKAATWTKQHPNVIYWSLVAAMAGAIAGACIAYFSGAIDPPALEKKFKALGLEIGAGVDLGKFNEQVLQSAKLSVSGGGTTVSGTVKDDAKEGWSAGADIKVGSDRFNVTGGFGYGQKGWSESLGLTLKPIVIPLEATAMVKFAPDGTTMLDASALYNHPSLGQYKLTTKGLLDGGKPEDRLAFTFGQENKDAGGSTGSASWTFNPTKPGTASYLFGANLYPGIHLDYGFTAGPSGVMTGQETKLTGEALKGAVKAELTYKADDKKTTVGGGVTIKQDDAEWAVKAAFTDGQLSDLSIKFGFKDKDEAVKFLVEASKSIADGVDKTQLKTMLQIKVGKLVWGLDLSASETLGGKKPGEAYGVSTQFIYTLPKGVLLGGSVDTSYGPRPDAWGKGGPAWQIQPGLEVGHQWSPVMLKGSVSVDPTGQMPPIWGLSVIGRK